MIRVASVPARHPYVMAITDPALVEILPDPTPLRVDVPGQWWPPRWLDPEYLHARIAEIDLLHVHFGFDAISADTLSAVCAALTAHRIPLVLTVHDLDNPHFADQRAHYDKLGILVSAAAAVITLTPGAAHLVGSRWRRSPVVLAHPYLLPLPDVGARRPRRNRPVVAVHGKSLRANIDPWSVLDVLSTAELDAAVRFDLDDDALDSPHAPRSLRARLAGYASRGVDVRVHQPFSDAELIEYLHEIEVLVLPYMFGTHSGWVEICHDAGVVTVVPSCGHLHEQQDVKVFGRDRDGLHRSSLLQAVRDAIVDAQAQDGAENLTRRRLRAQQRRHVRQQHVRIYRRCVQSGPQRHASTVPGRPNARGGVPEYVCLNCAAHPAGL